MPLSGRRKPGNPQRHEKNMQTLGKGRSLLVSNAETLCCEATVRTTAPPFCLIKNTTEIKINQTDSHSQHNSITDMIMLFVCQVQICCLLVGPFYLHTHLSAKWFMLRISMLYRTILSYIMLLFLSSPKKTKMVTFTKNCLKCCFQSQNTSEPGVSKDLRMNFMYTNTC